MWKFKLFFIIAFLKYRIGKLEKISTKCPKPVVNSSWNLTSSAMIWQPLLAKQRQVELNWLNYFWLISWKTNWNVRTISSFSFLMKNGQSFWDRKNCLHGRAHPSPHDSNWHHKWLRWHQKWWLVNYLSIPGWWPRWHLLKLPL